MIVFLLGAWAINKLREMQVGQYIRDDGPPNHKDKAGTPTMGGCIIIPVIMVSTALWADPTDICLAGDVYHLLFRAHRVCG